MPLLNCGLAGLDRAVIMNQADLVTTDLVQRGPEKPGWLSRACQREGEEKKETKRLKNLLSLSHKSLPGARGTLRFVKPLSGFE